MQELVGRLTALDPEAGEGLKVIAYFDALAAGGVGIDGLLGGAAVLAGTVAGAEVQGKVRRRDPSGARLDVSPSAPRSSSRSGPGWSVWLERAERPHANDAMVVERLALAVEQVIARSVPDSGLDILIDETRSSTDRVSALSRLRLDPATRVRLIASVPDDIPSNEPSTLVPTNFGVLRATLDVPGDRTLRSRAGLGTWERADGASASWRSAIIAFRLTDSNVPVVDATDLGAMLLLAEAYDPRSPHKDVLALDRLDARTAAILRVLVEADSIRAAALQLGMHHSSLHARHDSLSRELGYDVRTVAGRIRYGAAELLRRLTDPAALQQGHSTGQDVTGSSHR